VSLEHRRWTIRRPDLPDAVVCWTETDTRFAQLTEIRSNVFSKYHALVLQANRRLTSGLQFQTNYTLSRASDNGQTRKRLLPTTCLSMPSTSRRGRAFAFDRRQKFVASVVYNPNPFNDGAAKHIFNGWTIAPILNAFSGQRVTGNIAATASIRSRSVSLPIRRRVAVRTVRAVRRGSRWCRATSSSSRTFGTWMRDFHDASASLRCEARVLAKASTSSTARRSRSSTARSITCLVPR
jgi:hypothetical protein